LSRYNLIKMFVFYGRVFIIKKKGRRYVCFM